MYHFIIDGREVQGRLASFIRRQLSAFQDPERKGTPKGDPIGFGRIKYHCVLLSMTNLSLIDISMDTGVSYGVLRKWNREQDFRDQVEHLVTRFANELWHLIRRREMHSQELEDRFYYGDRIKLKLLNFFRQRAEFEDGLDLADINYYLTLFGEREKGGMGKRGITKEGRMSKEAREELRKTDRMVFNRLVEMGRSELTKEIPGRQELETIFSYLVRINRLKE